MNSLGETAQRLIQSHPESAEDLQEKCTELNQAWNSLGKRADQRKEKLGDSHDLQRFLSDFRWRVYLPPTQFVCLLYYTLKYIWLSVPQEYFWGGFEKELFFLFLLILVEEGKNCLLICVCRDLMSWINGIRGLVSSDELAKDVTGAEALLERHQVCERLWVCIISINRCLFFLHSPLTDPKIDQLQLCPLFIC